LRQWSRMNPAERAPDSNEQVLIYQSLLGVWPIEPDRFKQYVTKALREGKTHSSWVDVDEDYENAVMHFIDRLYTSEEFLMGLNKLHKKISYFGSLGSLAQSLLKITSPGVPDLYRGAELWDLSLADPDNRRPVDFTHRKRMLDELKNGAKPRDLLKNWPDGRIKLFVIWKGLHFRRSNPDLFAKGDYIPLRAHGPRQDHIVAFARRSGNQWALVVAPRLVAKLTRAGSPPLGPKVWLDTAIELPPDAPTRWTNVFTGEELANPLSAACLFRTFPLCLAGPLDRSLRV